MLEQGKGVKTRKIESRKQWSKPIVTTIGAADLKKHIQAAARSISCPGQGR